MIPQFNVRKGSAGGAGGFDSIDTITSTPIEVSDFPPANPSMDGDELGYDLSRAGEGKNHLSSKDFINCLSLFQVYLFEITLPNSLIHTSTKKRSS